MRAREYGKEFPERALMARISSLLGLKHFTTSNGGTVRRDFLHAVGEAIGFSSDELNALSTKEHVVEALIRATNDGDFDPAVLSTEGNVTNAALETIAAGVERSAHLQDALIRAEQSGVAVGMDPQPLFTTGSLDPLDVEDLRRTRLATIAVRDGQNRFRAELLEAYGSRCAVTGTNATEVLEAAHISPHRGRKTNFAGNGLLLRADIHALFDRGSIAVNESTLDVLFDGHLLTTTYRDLVNSKPRLRLPRLIAHRPQRDLLRAHRMWAGL